MVWVVFVGEKERVKLLNGGAVLAPLISYMGGFVYST